MGKGGLGSCRRDTFKLVFIILLKQDWELTMAQIMNSLLPNSDLN